MFDLELIKRIMVSDDSFSLTIKKLKLVKKVLNDEDLALLRKVFFCEDLGISINKEVLYDFLKYYGADNIYVGERVDYYSNGQLKLRSMRGKSLLPDIDVSPRKTLFKHDEYDYYYYDLLDDNRKCEHVHPDIFYVRDGCDNMKKITSILDKPKGKVRRG